MACRCLITFIGLVVVSLPFRGQSPQGSLCASTGDFPLKLDDGISAIHIFDLQDDDHNQPVLARLANATGSQP